MTTEVQLSLREALLYLISGGGGALVYWLMEKVRFFKELRNDVKRYAAFLLSGVLPVVAWVVYLGLGYDVPPATWQEWVERIFSLALAAILASQGIHAYKKLRPAAKE